MERLLSDEKELLSKWKNRLDRMSDANYNERERRGVLKWAIEDLENMIIRHEKEMMRK